LGGRSLVRAKEQLHRHLGRTAYALRNVGEGSQQGTPQTVVSALIRQAKTIPNELYKSLTWDRGKELADHRRFTLATNIDVYFCDPQSPWQRGSNENTNGLLTDLSVYSQTQLNRVARQLNERPRKTLGFATPAERFNACVGSIA
jgi:IS30 family transposase